MSSISKIDPGKIIQIVSSEGIAGSTTTSTSLVDVTSGSLSITPQFSDSTILVICNFQASHTNVSSTNVTYFASVLRGATDISGANKIEVRSYSGSGGEAIDTRVSWIGVDSPATTSATTYKLQHRVDNGSTTGATEDINITLLEIKAG